MANVNINGVRLTFDKHRRKVGDQQVSVLVGYTAKYALFVHEDLEAAHGSAYNAKHAEAIAAGRDHPRKPQEQAKFLEQPAREFRGEMSRIFTRAMQRGATMQEALLLVGYKLLRESQEIVPVDENNLRPSGFVRPG